MCGNNRRIYSILFMREICRNFVDRMNDLCRAGIRLPRRAPSVIRVRRPTTPASLVKNETFPILSSPQPVFRQCTRRGVSSRCTLAYACMRALRAPTHIFVQNRDFRNTGVKKRRGPKVGENAQKTHHALLPPIFLPEISLSNQDQFRLLSSRRAYKQCTRHKM